jgi:hypothetical protein
MKSALQDGIPEFQRVQGQVEKSRRIEPAILSDNLRGIGP